jgi:HAD superfamily hydrolase (TIGR01484 family)
VTPLASLSPEQALGLRGVLFDLDDTLLTHGALTLEAYQALHALAAAGLALVGVTGRPVGFAEIVLRQWPVAAMIAENGALAVRKHQGRTEVVDWASPAVRRERSVALADLAEHVHQELPHVPRTQDAHLRVADCTWDIGEYYRAAPEDLGTLARLTAEHGARVFCSSVHFHATYDTVDKAQGVLRLLQELWDVDSSAALGDYAFIGDSGNDRSCFAAFRCAIGVANVHQNLHALPVPPRFVTQAPMGLGFSEMAKILLQRRAEHGNRVGPSR